MAKDKETKTEETPITEQSQPLSARDRYRQRVNAEQFGDDEEAYYNAANSRLDDYEALQSGVKNLNAVMDNNPSFARMIVEAKRNKDFNPVLFMIQNGELDLTSLQDNPDYADEVAKAQNDWLEKMAKSEEADRLLAENLQKDIQGCVEDAQAMGLSEEEAMEQVGRTLEYLDKLERGEFRELFHIILKGGKYDADVTSAMEQGEANGRATKVRDTLRSMPKSTPRSGGMQRQGSESNPTEEESMFGV